MLNKVREWLSGKQPQRELLPGVKLLRTLEGYEIINSVAFDPEGRTLADSVVQLWDVATGKALRTVQIKTLAHNVAFDRAGRKLASANVGGTVKLWGVVDGKQLQSLVGHKGPIFSVAFHPAGQMLASGSGDATVKLWDLASGKLVRTLEGHNSRVSSVVFDPAGRTLASGSHDRR